MYTSHGYYLRLVFISLRTSDCVATIHTLIVLLTRSCMIWSGSFVGPSVYHWSMCLSICQSICRLSQYVCLSISLYLSCLPVSICMSLPLSVSICPPICCLSHSVYCLPPSTCCLSVDVHLNISLTSSAHRGG